MKLCTTVQEVPAQSGNEVMVLKVSLQDSGTLEALLKPMLSMS